MVPEKIPETRMRLAFNGWTRGLFKGMHFTRVLNLGCGDDVDREGSHYSVKGRYFSFDMIEKVDAASDTFYDPKEGPFLQGETYDFTIGGSIRVRNKQHFLARAEDIPFFDGLFDLVFCNWCFHDFDREEALKEIYRVLKPGGLFFASYCKPPDSFMEQTRVMLENTFRILAYSRLYLREDLDGRDGYAEAILGEKQ